MTLLNALLAVNWLEQKHQGSLTRSAITPVKPLTPEQNANIDANLEKMRADPEGFSAWTGRRGIFTLMRMGIFGMTEAEKTEALKAYRHSAGLPSI